MTTTIMYPMVIGLEAKDLARDDVAGDIWHDAFFGTPAVDGTSVVIGCHAGI